MITEESRDFITSIARCLDVIRAFDGEQAEMTPADVAAKTNLTRATARRILLTLNALGYVASDGKWFRLSPKILDLGYAYLTSMNVGQIIQPIINEASRKVSETCVISVLEGADVISVAHSAAVRSARLTFYPSSRLPACSTAAGRVMLADQDEDELNEWLRQVELESLTPKSINSRTLLKKEIENAGKQGYAYVDSEVEIGLFTLAVPVRNDVDKVIAAASFGGNVARINKGNFREKYLPEIKRVARQIGQLLPDRHHIM